MAPPIDIIIPVCNEEDALAAFHEELRKLPMATRLIFVDNGSTDNSRQIIATFDEAILIEHRTNRGYGASLKSGIGRAEAEKIIIIDGDGEYDPGAIPKIVSELDRHCAVHSSRFLEGGKSRMTRFRFLGNTLITALFNLLYAQKLTDLYTGCKGYRRDCLKDLLLDRDGFEHVLEISARLARRKVDIVEVPIGYRSRRTGRSKMRHFREAMKYLFWVCYYRFLPSRLI